MIKKRRGTDSSPDRKSSLMFWKSSNAPHRPTHILYEFLPDQPLLVNPILFILSICIAAGAFKNYTTVEDVLGVKPPQNQRYWVLQWADHILDRPVFPEVSMDGLSQKIQTGASFSKQLKELSLRKGMEAHVTIHSGRRETLIQATSKQVSYMLRSPC